MCGPQLCSLVEGSGLGVGSIWRSPAWFQRQTGSLNVTPGNAKGHCVFPDVRFAQSQSAGVQRVQGRHKWRSADFPDLGLAVAELH